MGSLIAGWDSLSQDQKTVNLERNKSCTREEIESFRRSHKIIPEHQLHHPHDDEVTSAQSFSNSSPDHHGTDDPIDQAKACKTKAWWTKSSWAYLNDPPQEIRKSAIKYAAQFHVAHLPED